MNRSALLFSAVFLAFCLPAFGQVELVGAITPEQILHRLPDWQDVGASYTPDLETIAKLQAFTDPVTVEIFLGTWCPDSKQHVGAYIRLMELVQNPLFRTTYVGVPRDKDARRPFCGDRDIQRIPTFIVSVLGQEKGRIIETPQVSVEKDLWRILQEK